MRLKEFWTDNKKTVVKLILNQFGATFLGIMLIMAAGTAEGAWLMLFVSCFASLFYLCLQYNVIWERGGQDRIKVDSGRIHKKPLTGLWIALCANIPNFILALMVLISQPFSDTMAWAANMNVAGRSLCLLWEGMYAGFVSYFSPHNPLIHLLYVFPSVIVITLGYLIGFSNHRILSVFEFNRAGKKRQEK